MPALVVFICKSLSSARQPGSVASRQVEVSLAASGPAMLAQKVGGLCCLQVECIYFWTPAMKAVHQVHCYVLSAITEEQQLQQAFNL
jgi:hypothetical protein